MQTLTSRTNATKVCALYEAGSISVCRAGDLVALNIHTTSGEVIIRMKERQFTADCRGPRDANGNPLRSFEELDAQARRRYDERQAAHDHAKNQSLGMSPE